MTCLRVVSDFFALTQLGTTELARLRCHKGILLSLIGGSVDNEQFIMSYEIPVALCIQAKLPSFGRYSFVT